MFAGLLIVSQSFLLIVSHVRKQSFESDLWWSALGIPLLLIQGVVVDKSEEHVGWHQLYLCAFAAYTIVFADVLLDEH